MAKSARPKKPTGARTQALAPSLLRQSVAFWREELPAKFGEPFTLKRLYDAADPCPICGGAKTYLPKKGAQRIPCFCRIQATYQKQIEGWQDHTYLPQRYLQINPDEILRVERGVTPIRRTQFSMALKAIDGFIANPKGNLILIGDSGMSRSMLAAYIATHLDPTPNIFITLRQLVDLLSKTHEPDSTHVQDILYRIPVLIVDNFSTTFGDLDNQAAQQLHDLIYYRWSEVLPVVLTTNVPLNDLRAVHGHLLEYLEQDAEVISFDAKQVHMSRSTGGAAVHRETSVPQPVQHCPYLGTADGTNPPGQFPSPGNDCLRVANPQPVALAHQSAACLSDFGGCPVFQTPDEVVVDALPADLLRAVRSDPASRGVSWKQRVIAAIAVIGVISGLVALGIILLGPRLGGANTPDVTQPIATDPPDSTVNAVPPTATITASPPSATPVPTVIPSPTPSVIMQVTLSLPTNLRQLPEANAPVVALLPAGTKLDVLGRDGLGVWVRVNTLDGQSGWVVVVQIAETIDVVSLPFYTDPTPAPPSVTPASLNASGSATPAAVSGIPASFTVLLVASDISGCSYPDITTDYTFNVSENQLEVIRAVDGTILAGTFTPANGAFIASATHSEFIETMSGEITLFGGVIRLRGEHTLSYFNGACSAFYSITGQTSANVPAAG